MTESLRLGKTSKTKSNLRSDNTMPHHSTRYCVHLKHQNIGVCFLTWISLITAFIWSFSWRRALKVCSDAVPEEHSLHQLSHNRFPAVSQFLWMETSGSSGFNEMHKSFCWFRTHIFKRNGLKYSHQKSHVLYYKPLSPPWGEAAACGPVCQVFWRCEAQLWLRLVTSIILAE